MHPLHPFIAWTTQLTAYGRGLGRIAVPCLDCAKVQGVQERVQTWASRHCQRDHETAEQMAQPSMREQRGSEARFYRRW